MTDTKWTAFLSELDWWVKQHGTAQVPQSAVSRPVDGRPYPLGRRVNTVRHNHAQGRLDPTRVAELEQRHGWRWRAAGDPEQTWSRNYAAVKDWHQTTGSLSHLHPSQLKWLQRQRKAAIADQLTSEQRDLLAAIPDALEGTYSRAEQFIRAARQWMQDNPGKTMADITRNDTVDLAGQTIKLQRRVTYYRGRRVGIEGSGPLTPGEIHAIEQLPGWTWNPSRGPNAPAKRRAKARR